MEYHAPEIELIRFFAEDIITESGEPDAVPNAAPEEVEIQSPENDDPVEEETPTEEVKEFLTLPVDGESE